MPSSIICQRCQCINEPYATICQKCGARFCPTCKLVIDSPNAKICPHCGKADLSFKPGKYAGSTYVAPGVSGSPSTQNYCSNCGSRVEAGVKKCPYCGRLGTLVTQVPRQGFGVMQPAHGGPEYKYTSAPEPERSTVQKVCSKCGTPIPPGSSLCPIHGKFGGGSSLKQGFAPKGTSVEAEAYRKMATRGTEAADHARPHTHRTPPEDIYPQAPGQAEGMEALPEALELRSCPNCGSSVPDRSKVCPNCGWNRLPQQKNRPIPKAEDFYKSREAGIQAYPPAYTPPAYAPYPPMDYTPYPPQSDPYYGQPAVQPYEENYPAPPGFIQEIYPQDKKRKKERKPKEAPYKQPARGQKKSPWSLLLALVALTGVIIIGAVLLMDMLKTPTPITSLPPSSTTSPGTVVAKPPVISNIAYSDIGKTSATVTWTTDKKSNSIVVYCLEDGNMCENAKDDALVTNHSVKLTGLEQGIGYHITVKSTATPDSDEPVWAELESPNVLRTTAVADTTPPKITAVKVTNITGSSATVTWTTDEPATSQVIYGTSITYGAKQPDQTDLTMVVSHVVELNGLPAQATFHFKVTSRDAEGNESSSVDKTFTTSAAAGYAIGNSAPDFTLPCADDTEVTLSDLRGKKVIINFWHYNCPPCMGEMPLLQEMHENHPDVPMLVIHNISLGSFNANQVGSIIMNQGYTFTVPLDSTGQVSGLYNISTIPMTFFLDSSGIIRKIQDESFSSLSAIEAMYNDY